MAKQGSGLGLGGLGNTSSGYISYAGAGVDPGMWPTTPLSTFDYMTPEDYNAILTGMGIPPGTFTDLINQAVIENWSEDEILARIYATPEFHQMFPGIFREDGSMRFSAAEYRSISDNYKSIARDYGVTGLSTGQISKLIGGNVSIHEFQTRMSAVQRYEEFKPALNAYRDILKAQGIDTSAIDGDAGLLKFVLGQAPKEFYRTYEQTNVLTQARTTGFVGKEQGVGMARRIAALTPGISSEQDLQEHFATLAVQARTVVPASQWARMGITKGDLVQLEFGGPRRAAVAERVQDVMSQQQAFREQVYVGGVGQTQRARREKAQTQ
jgi:hypothetical protein